MSRVPRKRRPLAEPPLQESGWMRDLPWQDDAAEAGLTLVDQHIQDLRDTAEQIARRSGAGTVAPSYVHRAAEHLGQHPPSAAADLLFGVGGMFFGAVLGVGGSLLVTPVMPPVWAIILILVVGVVSSAACAAGATMKLMRR